MFLRTLWLALAVLCLTSAAYAQWDDDPPDEGPPGTKRATERPGKAGADVLEPARVEFVESVDARTVMLSCDGEGADQAAAIQAARWNCLVGFIDKFLNLTAEQKKVFEKAAPSFRADLDQFVSKPPPGSADGRGRGVKSTTRVSDARVRVQLVASLEFIGLVRVLQERAIIPRFSPLLVMVELVEEAKKAGNLMFQSALVERLTMWGWEVREPRNLGGSGSGEQAADLLEMARMDSDLVIQLDVLIDKRPDGGVSAAVSLKAVEPPSENIVAQAVVASPARAGWRPGEENKAVFDALNDAAFQLWPQLFTYQARLERDGVPLRVVLQGILLPEKQLLEAMNRHCSAVRLLPPNGKDTEAFARCQPDKFMDLAGALDELLARSKYKDRYEFSGKTPHLVRVKAAQ